MKKVFVVICDGFEDIETITPIDVLRRAGAELSVVSENDEVRSARGLRVHSEMSLTKALELSADCDMVVLPGGLQNSQAIAASVEIRALVEKVVAKGGFVAAICASPALALGAWGIVDGKDFTCYPEMGADLPTKPQYEKRVVRDGQVITACGAGASEEFSLELVSALYGSDAMETLRKSLCAR